MKKCYILCLILLMLLSLSVPAAAFEANISVQAGKDGNDTIAVTVQNDEIKGFVSTVILTPDENAVFLEQQRTAAENIFSFKLSSDDKKEESYLVRVSLSGTEDSDELKEIPVSYYTYAQQQEAIRAIINPVALLAVIEEKSEILGLPVNGLYSKLTSADKVKKVLEEEYKTQYEQNTDIEVAEFLKSFDNAVMTAALNSGETELLSYVIENYAEKLGISDSEELKWYNASKKQSEILSVLVKESYSGAESFKNMFFAQSFLQELSTLHYSNVMKFIKDNSSDYSLIEVSLTDYNALKDEQKDYFAMQIAGIRYGTPEDFENAFSDALKKAEKYSEKNNNSGGSGGGSGGGSSVGSSSAVSAVETIGTVTKQEPGISKTCFDDVAASHWAYEAIEALSKEGIVNGVGSDSFAPDGYVTREQFVKIIVGAFGFDLTYDGEGFYDTDDNEWYAPYVKTAVKNGIVKGIDEKNFGVGMKISREDMAVMLYRTAKLIGKIPAESIDRVPSDFEEISDYAKEAVTAFYRAGVINGIEDGIFAPSENATRAQAAKIIYDLRGLGQ